MTKAGDLYLWGWNHAGQLGRESTSLDSHWIGSTDISSLLSPIVPLSNIKVETVSLGHTHTSILKGVLVVYLDLETREEDKSLLVWTKPMEHETCVTPPP